MSGRLSRRGLLAAFGVCVLAAAFAGAAIPPPDPELEMLKEALDVNGGSVCPGDIIRFTLTVTNPGGAINPVAITDGVDKDCYESFTVITSNADSPFALGARDQSTQPNPGVSNGTVKVNGWAMPGNSRVRLIYEARVWQLARPNELCCGAAVFQFGLDLMVSNTVCVTRDCVPPGSPNLLPTKTVSVAGRVATFTIAVSNAGTGPDRDVVIDDSLDVDARNFRLVSTSHGSASFTPAPAGQYGNGLLVVSGFGLAAGETATVVFEVEAPPRCGPTTQICNQGVVTSDGITALGETERLTDADPTNGVRNEPTCASFPNTSTPVISASKSVALLVDVDGDGTTEPGDTVRWAIPVVNATTCDALAEVRDDLPAFLVAVSNVTVSGSPSYSDISSATQVLVTDMTVPAMSTVTVTWDATVDAAAGNQSICNLAETRLLPFGLPQDTNESCFDVGTTTQPCVTLPAAIRQLKAVKRPTASDASFSWQEEASSDGGYAVYRVSTASEIPVANGNASPPSLLPACSTTLKPDVTCTHAGAVPLPPALGFYQVVGICIDGQEGVN